MIRMLLLLAAIVTVTAIFQDRNEDLTRSIARQRRQSADSQNCSIAIGQLRWPLSDSDRIDGGGGTYFLPDEVSCNGRLVSVQTCFFYNDGGNNSNNDFRLHVGVFRRVGDNYTRDDWTNIDVTRQNSSETWGCTSINLSLPVQAGDWIAVQVWNTCQLRCPLQPNLNASGSTLIFFTPAFVDTIPVSQVMATQNYTNVYLDVSVSIDPVTGRCAVGAIAGIVVPGIVIVIAVILALTAVIIWCIHSHSKNRKPTNSFGENDHPNDGDLHLHAQPLNDGVLQIECQQMKRPQSYAQPLDTIQSIPSSSSPNGIPAYSTYTELLAHATANTTAPNPSPGNLSGHYEMDVNIQELYWHPSSMEDELRMQLMNLEVQEIPREDLQLQEYLGSGQFGTVNRGVWSPSPSSSSPGVEVAVKSLEGEPTEEERVKFLQEAAIMGQFKHPNIIRIAGVITISDPLLIVCELMRKGDLHHYLLSLRPQSGSNLPSRMPDILLCFSRQIASGMSYLACKSFVHRDLAARNILVSENNVCKIADFGLSRDLQNEDYYVSHGGKIPVKWTAPEALNYRKYSTASDVWSYGVLLYEIWAMGIKPFQDYTNSEALQKVLEGYRLPPPPGCPKQVYELMIKCWHPDPDSRPAFCNLMLLLLQRPDFELLRWSEEDEATFSKKARTLGGPLEDGEELYTELQSSFSKSGNSATNFKCSH